MRPLFPLFQSHLDLAHQYWNNFLKKGDIVIDATCGNGHDTLKLSQLVLSDNVSFGKVYAFDIQLEAIQLTQKYLSLHLSEEKYQRVIFEHRCHGTFPTAILPESVALIVYNLGYLPGGDKSYTTQYETTQRSIKQAQQLLRPGGALSITCYPGHAEGAKEEEAIRAYTSTLLAKEWSCCYHQWLNRRKAPGFLFMQKALCN
jgi:predicted methyltransferase